MSVDRRAFLKSILAAIPMTAFDWDAFPRAGRSQKSGSGYDAIIIGSGLGGLSCAAAFARKGFKPLVLEQHSVPGGYATTFKRPGGFVFDVSLHSTSVSERNGMANLISGFPEITDVEFVPHRTLYRAIFPEHDIRVPHKDIAGYIKTLHGHFPDEKEAIDGIFNDIKGLPDDLNRYSAANGKINFATFAKDFPVLSRAVGQTWGTMVDARTKDPKVKGIVSALWGYFGLPPSKLASIYYALPLYGYLAEGGYYPIGKSQKISDGFVRYIEGHGGKVQLKTRVEKILTKDHEAFGVRTSDGAEITARAVVSNANAYDTVHAMLDEAEFLKDYLARMDKFTASISSFQVWLGLKKDLVGELGLKDTEIFYYSGYDMESAYTEAMNADMRNPGFGLTLYDNLYKGYSPQGKNIVNIISLQGYEPWKRFEADYLKGNKDAYRAEKKRIADILIQTAEKMLMPGLSKAIEVMEAATPLTNLRYTSNYRGAIYGWDQTLENSMPRRLGQKTPVRGLYLAGAWTQPGGGYGAVIPSGLQCFGEIMRDWSKSG